MPGKLNERHIRKTAIELGIPADFVRKDFFVTKAIRTLATVEDEYFALIFQGGTSLSKGHQVINRLSEDVDFRVVQKHHAKKLGKDTRRKKLRDFRYALVAALTNNGFKVGNEDIKVFYEGRFMSIRAAFDESEKLAYLKPHVSVDCFMGELLLDPKITNISSLIKVTLGNECDHTFFPVNCLSLDETAAEKWVALTRRIAATQTKERSTDKHLVRHLYDLSQLYKKDLLTNQYHLIVKNIILKDKNLFEKQNPAYASNPLDTSELALNLLFRDEHWQNHWNLFLQQMVYEKDKPTFEEACHHLQMMSKQIFANLKSNI